MVVFFFWFEVLNKNGVLQSVVFVLFYLLKKKKKTDRDVRELMSSRHIASLFN